MRLSGRSLPWFVLYLLLRASVSAQTITEFPLPEDAQPRRIVAGADGALWFLDGGSIGRITPGESVVHFPIEGPALGFPWDIASGPDGNLWFTEADDGQGAIVRVTPLGEQTRTAVPHGTVPFDVTAGPDGNLWLTFGNFLSSDGAAIGRARIGGDLTLFAIPGTARNSFEDIPSDITAGPDGNVWFTQKRFNEIGRITPAGAIREFSVPSSGPIGIAAGSDGNLWFTQSDADRIGRITPDGVVTNFPISTRGRQIIPGPDGALWFTQTASNLGRITASGFITEIPIAAPAESITTGPDGNIWFTAAGSVWRLTVPRLPTLDSRILPVVGSTAGVSGSFFRTSVQLHNSTGEPMTGRIVFHPSGVSGNESDPALFYALSPGQTQSIADLLPVMGRSGLGSADIEVTSGSIPTTNARVFNDAGLEGTMGFTEEPTRSDDALRPGQPGALLLPSDLTNFRFNVGVRTLRDGATVTLTLRDAAGALVATSSRVFPATYHEQQSATAFLGTSTLPVGGSLSIEVNSGAAIFYGAAVDNTTGDPSFQIARPEL